MNPSAEKGTWQRPGGGDCSASKLSWRQVALQGNQREWSPPYCCRWQTRCIRDLQYIPGGACRGLQTARQSIRDGKNTVIHITLLFGKDTWARSCSLLWQIRPSKNSPCLGKPSGFAEQLQWLPCHPPPDLQCRGYVRRRRVWLWFLYAPANPCWLPVLQTQLEILESSWFLSFSQLIHQE